jgi:hypothetical protein
MHGIHGIKIKIVSFVTNCSWRNLLTETLTVWQCNSWNLTVPVVVWMDYADSGLYGKVLPYFEREKEPVQSSFYQR